MFYTKKIGATRSLSELFRLNIQPSHPNPTKTVEPLLANTSSYTLAYRYPNRSRRLHHLSEIITLRQSCKRWPVTRSYLRARSHRPQELPFRPRHPSPRRLQPRPPPRYRSPPPRHRRQSVPPQYGLSGPHGHADHHHRRSHHDGYSEQERDHRRARSRPRYRRYSVETYERRYTEITTPRRRRFWDIFR